MNTNNTKPDPSEIVRKATRTKILRAKIEPGVLFTLPFDVLIEVIVDLEGEVQQLKADVDTLKSTYGA